MSSVLLQAAAGLSLLYFGGEMLVRGAASLASRLGISPLAIGLTVVAFGTSAPELVVSLNAALSGANDISVGNVVGSNIANLALILGLAVLIRPAEVAAKIVRIDAPILIAASLALVAILSDGTATRFEGALLVVGLVGYIAFTFWEAGQETAPVRKALASAAPEAHATAPIAVGFLLAGLVFLIGGGHLLVTSAVSLATSFGIPQATIGLTVVAIGTSLPEFATSVVAAMKSQGDIAIGNLVGSNLFNILGILGVTAIVRPLSMGAISWIDLGMMVGVACVVTALIAVRGALGRIEGAALLAGFVFYTSWLLTG